MSYQSEIKLYQQAIDSLVGLGYASTGFVAKSQSSAKARLKKVLRGLEIDGKTKEILTTDENWALAAKAVADLEDDLDMTFTRPGQDWITNLKQRAYFTGQKYEHQLIHGGDPSRAMILEGIDGTMLRGLKDNGYTLIRGVAQDQIDCISRTLTEGILHNRLHSEVQDHLIRDGKIPALIVTDKNGVKRFLEMEWRIEMITRTETSRVAELGRKDKAKEFYGDELWGRWHSLPDARPSHLKRNNLAQPLADWEAGAGPDGKAIMPGEEVNCRCWMEWGDADTLARRMQEEDFPAEPPEPPAPPEPPKPAKPATPKKGKKKAPNLGDAADMADFGGWSRAEPELDDVSYRLYEAACKRGLDDDIAGFGRMTMHEVQVIDDKIAKGILKPNKPLSRKAWEKKATAQWSDDLAYLEKKGIRVNNSYTWDKDKQIFRELGPGEVGLDGLPGRLRPQELSDFRRHYDSLSQTVKDTIAGKGAGKPAEIHIARIVAQDPDFLVRMTRMADEAPEVFRQWYKLPHNKKLTPDVVWDTVRMRYNEHVGGVCCYKQGYVSGLDDFTQIYCQGAWQYSQEGAVLHHEVGHYLDELAGRWSIGAQFELDVIKKGTIKKLQPFPGGRPTKVVQEMYEITGRTYGARPGVPQEIWADMHSLFTDKKPRTWWGGDHPDWVGMSPSELLKNRFPEAWELMRRVDEGALGLGGDQMLVGTVFTKLGIFDEKVKKAWIKKHLKKAGSVPDEMLGPAQMKAMAKQYIDEIPDDLAAFMADGGPSTEIFLQKLPDDLGGLYQRGVGYIRPEAIGTKEAYAELVRASVNQEILYRQGAGAYTDLVRTARIPRVAIEGAQKLGLHPAAQSYDVVDNMLSIVGQVYKEGMSATQHLDAVLGLNLEVRVWEGATIPGGEVMVGFLGKHAAMTYEDIGPFIMLWRQHAMISTTGAL